MFRYIAKRVLQAIPLLFVISFIVFSLIHIAPYDVIDSITTPNMSQEQIDLLRQRYGLDQPFLVQYFLWIRNVLTGNLGFSLVSQSSISQELATRIPNTMRLVIPAYLTALLLAIILGLLAAANKGKIWDRIIDAVASLGIAVPTFWFAMILIYVFGYLLNMFPIIGMYTVGKEGDFGVMVQRAFHASKWQIFSRHISRNILIPVVTQIGLALPMLVTGAIITETIYGWPGVGPYLMSATKSLDYPVIMAIMLLSATLVILGNLLADVLYSVVDPRIRKGGSK